MINKKAKSYQQNSTGGGVLIINDLHFFQNKTKFLVISY